MASRFGGDGTVSKVANRLIAANSQIPLSVLPLGTANNFARSLGFCLSKTQLFEQLNGGKHEILDVGEAYGPWGKRYFFEGAGAGLFADYLRAPDRSEKTGAKKSKAAERSVRSTRVVLSQKAAAHKNLPL